MNNMRIGAAALLFLLLAWAGHGAAGPGERLSTLADQKEVAVTIYNENLALVKDRRTLFLPAGPSTLAFLDVSGKMRPETALLQGGKRGDITVLEQSFAFDPLTPGRLLEAYVGKTIGIVRTHPTTGEETAEEAVVLSAANGVILRVGDRIETGASGGSWPHDPRAG